MSATSFKELCLDTTRTDGVVGRFWAEITGCSFQSGTAEQSGAELFDQIDEAGEKA